MPRTARIDIPDLLQHVIVRGIDQCDIFRDDSDRKRFLQSLAKLLVQTGTDCLAWSLMTNHVHLLLRPRRTLLAPFMRKLLTGYAIYFNPRHKRSGHLFQNRYKSIVCEENTYLLELVRYIHLNPLRVGLVDDLSGLDRYAWSGHSVVVGSQVLAGQCVDEVLAMFAPGKREAVKRYRRFVADGVALGKRIELGGERRITKDLLAELDEESYDARILGTGEFIKELRRMRELDAKFPQVLTIREIVAKICNHYELEPETLQQKSRAAKVTTARSIICYVAVRLMGHNGSEVGKQLNLLRAGVSVAADRGEQIVKGDPTLLTLVDK